MGWADWPTAGLAVALGFLFGYSLTVGPVLRSGIALRGAIKITLATDTVPIMVIEITDNAVILTVPGAMDADVLDLLFWASLALSFVVAFFVTLPVNRWLIRRGRGHAVVHTHH